MSGELTLSGLGNVRATNILNREVYTLLYDPTDLRATCVKIPFDMMGAGSLKIAQVDVDLAMAAPGEATGSSNTGLTTATYSLTPARYALRVEPDDLLVMTSVPGVVDVQSLARIIFNTTGLTATDILCALFGSLSNYVGGGAGVALTVDDWFDAMYQLNSSLVPGPYYSVLNPTQVNSLIASLRGETGALQFQAATADMLALKGPGYKGSLLGVDLWQSDSCATASSYRIGAMYGRGCYTYTEAPVSRITPQIDRRIAVADSGCFVTSVWDDDLATWRLIGNYYPAFKEAEDARGVHIRSDS